MKGETALAELPVVAQVDQSFHTVALFLTALLAAS